MSGAEPQECTICMEIVVVESSERASSRLRCGHYFHLDCIASAFNSLGRMQCPNCRSEENGSWRFAAARVDNIANANVPAAAAANAPAFIAPRINPAHHDDHSTFILTADEFYNFMTNGFPDDLTAYLRTREIPQSEVNNGRALTLQRVRLPRPATPPTAAPPPPAAATTAGLSFGAARVAASTRAAVTRLSQAASNGEGSSGTFTARRRPGAIGGSGASISGGGASGAVRTRPRFRTPRGPYAPPEDHNRE